jgi:hypothetical protein
MDSTWTGTDKLNVIVENYALLILEKESNR